MISIIKRLLLLCLVAGINVLTCAAQDSNNPPSNESITAALNTLKDTEAMPNPMNGFGATNKSEYQQCLANYHKQMDAIIVLGQAKIPGTASLLLPYLNYPTQDFPIVRWEGIHSMMLSTNELKSLWPVLGSLIEIPGSSQALANYALDQKNPADFRFAAFHALRYVDKHQMQTVGNALEVEFSKYKKANALVSWIEDDNQAHPYMGTMWFYDVSK